MRSVWIDDGNGKTHTKTCQRTFCDETVTEHKVGDNHHFTKTGHLDPKCKEDGYDEYTCSECGYKYREPISQTDHDWGDWFVTVESTINNKGEEKRICKNDSSHTQRRETPIIESYTATFMIGDKVIDVVRFAKDTKSIVNPTVEEKANYTFSWDDYELKNADIVIHGHYDPINPDDISDIKTEKTAEYKDGTASITLSAAAATKTIKYTSKSQKPYDFIFVLDASGSMDERLDSRKTKIDALNCSCICHKALNSKLYKVLYKICRVFWRLFSVRRNCECGHYHY